MTTVGDAATRQGDFFEAVCFAKEKQLPVMFVVEDNAYGISSPTRKINPLAIGVLQPNDWIEVDGADVQAVHDVASKAIEGLRAGKGPSFLWVKMERLSSHTSTDDQKLYRSAEELQDLEKGDPLKRWKEQLMEEGVITAEEYDKLDNEIKERVRQEFADADREKDPSADELELHVTAEAPELTDDVLPPGKYRIGDTINKALRAGLEKDSRRIIFGEDIEDPKGGVFRLTQKLSTDFPKAGLQFSARGVDDSGCRLRSRLVREAAGFRVAVYRFHQPGLEPARHQSLDVALAFVWHVDMPGRDLCSVWRVSSRRQPLAQPGQRGALAHYPGINIVIPSTPEDAAGLLWTAMHCEDPTFVLIPKHLLWAEHESTEPVRAVPLGKARKRSSGSDVTLVAWGNTIEKSLEALEKIGGEASVELIDLRSIVPWDRAAIEESVRRTGRLIVVQEDTENCSVGQMIITHITGQPDIWNAMVSPPILVSKGNVMIGYNPIYEYAALPDVERIVAAVRRSISTKQARAVGAAGVDRGRAEPELIRPGSAPPATVAQTKVSKKQSSQRITIPIMGEGIRNAKVVALLKKPGDAVALDDPLCEVETDKAVYPIESSFAGTMGEWKTEVGATVEIGQEIGTILAEGDSFADQFETAAEVSPHNPNGEVATVSTAGSKRETAPAAARESAAIEPALSPTIIRRLGRVVPANLQIDARWDAIRKARETAKKKDGKNAASPSVMIAWAVVKAMEKHAPFRRVILEDDRIVENDEFDLGVAVSLDDDRLATAVVTHANKRDWPDFVQRYNQTVEETRGGRVDAVNAPIVISSLGAFGVRAAAPIVVPPSVGTLFVGSAHYETFGDGKKSQAAEVITLSLTFDHRVVNGAGAASFVHEVKEQIEKFKLSL